MGAAKPRQADFPISPKASSSLDSTGHRVPHPREVPGLTGPRILEINSGGISGCWSQTNHASLTGPGGNLRQIAS